MSIKQYRKKPVVVEAYQFTVDIIKNYLFYGVCLPQGLQFCQAQYNPTEKTLDNYTVRIDTLEGETYKVEEGDWIIRGISGEFYPCKPDIFEKTYEEVK